VSKKKAKANATVNGKDDGMKISVCILCDVKEIIMLSRRMANCWLTVLRKWLMKELNLKKY